MIGELTPVTGEKALGSSHICRKCREATVCSSVNGDSQVFSFPISLDPEMVCPAKDFVAWKPGYSRAFAFSNLFPLLVESVRNVEYQFIMHNSYPHRRKHCEQIQVVGWHSAKIGSSKAN